MIYVTYIKEILVLERSKVMEIKRESLVDRAYSAIKKNIITLKYKPGMKLDEKELVKNIGIGRTPTREALKMLISEGLVVNNGKNSIYVKDLTLTSAKDLKSILFNLGDLIFGLANPNGDFSAEINELDTLSNQMDELLEKEEYFEFVKVNNKFHRAFAKIARNEFLDAIIERIYNEEMRLTFILSSDAVNPLELKEYYAKVKAQHKQFIGLLKRKDFDGLKELYKFHFREGNTRLFNYFSGAATTVY